MTPGELIRQVAKGTEIPTATVAVYARVIREAGLLTTGARGVNAPQMTPLDGARLLLALVATDKPSLAAHAVRDFGRLASYRFSRAGDGLIAAKLRELPEGHSLEEAMAELLQILPSAPAREELKAFN